MLILAVTYLSTENPIKENRLNNMASFNKIAIFHYAVHIYNRDKMQHINHMCIIQVTFVAVIFFL